MTLLNGITNTIFSGAQATQGYVQLFLQGRFHHVFVHATKVTCRCVTDIVATYVDYNICVCLVVYVCQFLSDVINSGSSVGTDMDMILESFRIYIFDD